MWIWDSTESQMPLTPLWQSQSLWHAIFITSINTCKHFHCSRSSPFGFSLQRQRYCKDAQYVKNPKHADESNTSVGKIAMTAHDINVESGPFSPPRTDLRVDSRDDYNLDCHPDLNWYFFLLIFDKGTEWTYIFPHQNTRVSSCAAQTARHLHR